MGSQNVGIDQTLLINTLCSGGEYFISRRHTRALESLRVQGIIFYLETIFSNF